MVDRPLDDLTCVLFRELLEWKKHPMKNYRCPKCGQKLRHYMRHSEEINGITKLHGIWGCSGWENTTCLFPMCERNFTEYTTLRTVEQFAAGFHPPPPELQTRRSVWTASTSNLVSGAEDGGCHLQGNAPSASSESRTVEAPGSLRTPFFPDDRPTTDDEQGQHDAVAIEHGTSSDVHESDPNEVVTHPQEELRSPTNLSEAETSKKLAILAKEEEETVKDNVTRNDVSENDAEGKMQRVVVEQPLKEEKASKSPTNLSEAESNKQPHVEEQNVGVPESEKPKDVGEIVTNEMDANEIDIHEVDIDLLLPTTSMAQKEQAQKEQRAPPETPTSLMLQQLTKYAINRPAIVPQMPKRSRGGRSKQNAPPAQSMASADQLKRAAVEHAQLLLRQKQKHAAEISARNSNSQGATSSLMSPSRRPQTSRQAHLEMEKKKKKRVEESPLSNSPSRALTQWMLKEKAVNKSPQAGGPKLDAVYVRKELSASMRRATNEVLKQSVPVVDVTNRLAGWTPVGAALAGSGGLTPSAITPSASPPPSGSTANVNRAFQDPELNALVQRKMAQVKQAFAPPAAPYGVHHVQSAPVMSDSGLYQLGSVPSYQQPTTHAGPWLTETIQTPTTHAGDWAMASFGHDVVDDWATPTALTTFPPMATSNQQISAVGGDLLEAPSTAPVAVDDVDKELDQSWEMDRGMTISDYFGL